MLKNFIPKLLILSVSLFCGISSSFGQITDSISSADIIDAGYSNIKGDTIQKNLRKRAIAFIKTNKVLQFNSILVNSSFQYQNNTLKDQVLTQNYFRNNIQASYSIASIPLKSSAYVNSEHGNFSYGVDRFNISFDKQAFEANQRKELERLQKEGIEKKNKLLTELVTVNKKSDSIAFLLRNLEHRTIDSSKSALEDSLKQQADSIQASPHNQKIASLQKQQEMLQTNKKTLLESLNKLKSLDSLQRKPNLLKSPLPKRIFSGVKTFDIGTFAPRYSSLLLKGIMMKGINTEFVINNFYAGFTGGSYSLTTPFNPGLTPSLKQKKDGELYMVRAGLGRPDKNHIHISFLSGNNYNPKQNSLLFNGTPIRSNKVLHADFSYALKKNITIKGEYAISSVQVNGFESAGLPNENISANNPTAFGIGKLSSWKVQGIAVYASTNIEIEAIKIAGNYFTLGNPFLRPDNLQFRLNIRQNIWKNYLQLTGSVQSSSNNLLRNKAYGTDTRNINVGARFQYKRLPVVLLSYSPNISNNTGNGLLFYASNTQKSLSVVHSVQKEKIKANLSFSYTALQITTKTATLQLENNVSTMAFISVINIKKLEISSQVLNQKTSGLYRRNTLTNETSVGVRMKSYACGVTAGLGTDNFTGKNFLLGVKADVAVLKNNKIQLTLRKMFFPDNLQLKNTLILNINLTQKI